MIYFIFTILSFLYNTEASHLMTNVDMVKRSNNIFVWDWMGSGYNIRVEAKYTQGKDYLSNTKFLYLRIIIPIVDIDPPDTKIIDKIYINDRDSHVFLFTYDTTSSGEAYFTDSPSYAEIAPLEVYDEENNIFYNNDITYETEYWYVQYTPTGYNEIYTHMATCVGIPLLIFIDRSQLYSENKWSDVLTNRMMVFNLELYDMEWENGTLVDNYILRAVPSSKHNDFPGDKTIILFIIFVVLWFLVSIFMLIIIILYTEIFFPKKCNKDIPR